MTLKYSNNLLVFLMDNLSAHKNTRIMKIMQEENVSLLLTPSNTPEFSPIENMFGYVKRKLQDMEFNNEVQVA